MECCVAAEPGTEWNGMESNKKYILLDFYSTRA